MASPPPPPPPRLPLAIVGGGVAGLAMALALQRHGIPALVFERDPSFERARQGYGMTLQATTALDELGILDAIRAADTPSREHWTFAPDGSVQGYFGNAFRRVSPDEAGRLRGNLRVPREVLRRILLERLSSSVAWGHTLERLEEGADCVTLHFSVRDGGAAVSMRACGVIGADGIHSRVRRCLGATEPLSYLGVLLILGTSTHLHPLLDRRGFYTLDGTHRLFTMPFRDSQAQAEADAAGAAPCPGHSGGTSLSMWQLTLRVESLDEARRIAAAVAPAAGGAPTPDGLAAEALARIGHWHEPVPALLAASLPGRTWATPLFDFGEPPGAVAVPPGRPAGGGAPPRRVTLIGDAAHPMSPFKGQGCNQALRDAVGLGAWLARTTTAASCGPAFAAHEREMAHRAGRKVLESRAAAGHLHSPAALLEPPAFAGLSDADAPVLLAAAQAAGIRASAVAELVPRMHALIEQLRQRGAIAPADPPSAGTAGQEAPSLPAPCVPSLAAAPPLAAEGSALPRWTLLYFVYQDLSAPGVREAVAAWLREHAASVGLVGRVRVAKDGLNASLGLARDALDAHVAAVQAHPLFRRHAIDWKFAPSAGPRSAGGTAGAAFDRFEAKLCDELVTLQVPAGTARPENSGVALTPELFHRALCEGRVPDGAAHGDDGHGSGGSSSSGSVLSAHSPAAPGGSPRMVLIDVRNEYETDVGTFVPPPDKVKLLLPNTRTFAEMPKWFEEHAEELAGKDILMCCTGGVRCVRTSALLRERGFDRVFHLQGGMQRYMEAAEAGRLRADTTAPAAAAVEVAASSAPSLLPSSLWAGKLFVFDERPAVTLAGRLPGGEPALRHSHDDNDDSGGAGVDGAAAACLTPASTSNPHIPGVRGRCLLCACPWDAYDWTRCDSCGVLVLVCPACTAARASEATGGGGSAAPAPPRQLACRQCAAAALVHPSRSLAAAPLAASPAAALGPSAAVCSEARVAQRTARGEARRAAAEASGAADVLREARRTKKAAAQAAAAAVASS